MTRAAFAGAAAIALCAAQVAAQPAGGVEVLRTQPTMPLLAASLWASPEQACPVGFAVQTATDRRFTCHQRVESRQAANVARVAAAVSCANGAYWNVGPVVQVVRRPRTHSDIFWICKHG